MKLRESKSSYRHIIPPAGGMIRQGSNKTKIARSAAMMSLVCDNCGDSYETYSCWFNKGGKKNHFCSCGCHIEWRKIKIIKSCEICYEHFTVSPTNWFRKVTCSRKCMIKKRSDFMINEASHMSLSPIYNFGNHETAIELGYAKFTVDQVQKIYLDARTQSVISAEFKISQSNVSNIKLGKTWGYATKHLTKLEKS